MTRPATPSWPATHWRSGDVTANLDSVGAHIWREFFAELTGGADRGGDFWRVAFDAEDPVNTPRDLDTENDAVIAAFDAAIAAVKASGFAFDATLGTIQHPCCILNDIAVFGGQFYEGAFTIADSSRLSDDGYQVSYGNSYIQTVTWEADGAGFKPHAEGFVTYSQSTDPASPHFADFTTEYSAKRWKRFPFRPAEIEADKISRTRLTE
jgi:acyl-homoserine-lactone acylase